MAWDDMTTPFLSVQIGATVPESVVYRPHGKAARAVMGVPEEDESGLYRFWSFANSATDGILAATLNTDHDKIDVPMISGEAASTRDILRIVRQDTGMVTIEVR